MTAPNLSITNRIPKQTIIVPIDAGDISASEINRTMIVMISSNTPNTFRISNKILPIVLDNNLSMNASKIHVQHTRHSIPESNKRSASML